MATIKGSLIWSSSSYAAKVTTRFQLDNGINWIEATNNIEGIPITIWNQNTKKGIVVKTNSTGSFTVNDVPTGTYYIVETYDVSTSNTGTVSYVNAVNMPVAPTDCDPSISYISSKGLVTNNGNRVASLTRNTFVNVISTSSSIVEIMFIDAPMIVYPISLGNYRYDGTNQIISADYGTFGTYPVGIPAGTSLTTCPYTEWTSGEYTTDLLNTEFYDNYIMYSSTTPDDNYYSIVNIANKHTFSNRWFDVASYDNANETDRYMIVNGDSPDEYVFKETININPANDYVFSFWILNIYRLEASELPKFTVTVKSPDGTVLYSKDISADSPLEVTTIPTWRQEGAIIPSSVLNGYTTLDIQATSTGLAARGNDYCIDDIQFRKVVERTFYPEATKSVSPTGDIEINDTLEYTIYLNNTTATSLSSISMSDLLQDGTYLANTDFNIILYNRIDKQIFNITESFSQGDLESGIDISQILIDNIDLITNSSNFIYEQDIVDLFNVGQLPEDFKISISYPLGFVYENLSSSCKLYNTARFDYSAPIGIDGAMVETTKLTNEVSTQVKCPNFDYVKSTAVIRNGEEIDLENGDSVLCGEQIVYKITITNHSIYELTDLIITDNIDSALIPVYSLSSNCKNGVSTEITWPPSYPPAEETFLPCSQITAIDGNVNNIEISGISVPAGNPNEEVQLGEVVVRIYCNTTCDDTD